MIFKQLSIKGSYLTSMPKAYSKLVLTSINKLLDLLAGLPEVPCGMPASAVISERLHISRTTVQKLIEILCEKGITRQDGTNKILLRRPLPSDYFTAEESERSKSDLVEKQILKKLSSYELKPGDRFSELELAKELDSNTITTREALLKIAASGIIKKHPHQKWEVIEFSAALIDEIAATRKLYEGYAIGSVRQLDGADPIWTKFAAVKQKHVILLKQTEISMADMRNLERDFHSVIIEASRNRFIESSYNSIFTLIVFHLWQIAFDKAKIKSVLTQHVTILQALLDKDFDHAQHEMEAHLEYAKDSMKDVNQLLIK